MNIDKNVNDEYIAKGQVQTMWSISTCGIKIAKIKGNKKGS